MTRSPYEAELPGGFRVSSNSDLVDTDLVAAFLTNDSYWAKGRPVKVIKRSIESSTCFGIYTEAGSQAAFARLVTDSITFGWVCDVFVLPEFRGDGLGKALMDHVVQYADRIGVGQLLLATRDAHGLYSDYGFASLDQPQKWMARLHPEVVKRVSE